MEIRIITHGERHWEVEMLGEDITLPSLLREALLENEDVEFAAYVQEHPQISAPKLVIRTRKKPAKEALKKAADKVGKRFEEFRGLLRKIRG